MSRRNLRNQQQTNPSNGGTKFLWLLIGLGSVAIIGLIGMLVWSITSAGETTGSATPAVTGTPKLQANVDKLEMGDIKLGRTVNAEFDLSNTGDRTLQFTAKPFIEVLEGC